MFKVERGCWGVCAHCRVGTPAFPRTGMARRYMRANGWGIVDGLTVCPDCKRKAELRWRAATGPTSAVSA